MLQAQHGPRAPRKSGPVTAVLVLLSVILALVTAYGMLGSFVAFVLTDPSNTQAWRNGWTPGHERAGYLPLVLSPLTVVAVVIGEIRQRRYSVLWLFAGYAVVIIDIVVFAAAMRGAPSWE